MKKTTKTKHLDKTISRTLTANDLKTVIGGTEAEVMNNPLYQPSGSSGTNPLYTPLDSSGANPLHKA